VRATAATAKPIDMSIGVFSDDQLIRVQQAYGLDSVLVLPFFALNETIIDLRRRTETARKVFIETDRGVFFLKELPWYCASADFADFQTGLLAQLSGLGSPVLMPSVTTSGTLFFHDRLTGSIFLLQPHLDGRSWTGRAGEARSAGGALADLHRAGSRVRVTASGGTRDAFASAHDLIGLLLAHWTGPAQARDDVREFARHALGTVGKCRDDAYAAGYGGSVIPVHGDYNPFNLIFAHGSDAVAGVVDFDNACMDDPAHDLAEALVRFGWVNYRGLSSAYGRVPTSFDRTSLDAVLRGYRDVDEAAADRMRPLLPPVMTAIALELAAIGLLSSYYTVDDLATLRRNTESLRAIALDAITSLW
jgi:Ser/Thr protein kinase RdoA (MazF antagonist)